MAWVRIHDGALSHPKLAGLVDLKQPFMLWVWGLSQCNMHLTDGVLARDTLPKVSVKAAAELVRRGLWEATDRGWIVHDYLEWNHARDTVKTRKLRAKERVERWRQRQRNAVAAPLVTPPISNPIQSNTNKTVPSVLSASDPVRIFLDWFQIQYRTQRHGAVYTVTWGREGAQVKRLLASLSMEDLQLCARVLLSDKTEDEFIVNSDRGIGVLAAKINWLMSRVTDWKNRHER